MTRDEAIECLVKNQTISIAWSSGLVDSLILLGVLKVGDVTPPVDKAIEAYEEALEAQKALDDVRHPL